MSEPGWSSAVIPPSNLRVTVKSSGGEPQSPLLPPRGVVAPQSPLEEACPRALILLARLVAAAEAILIPPRHYEGPSPGSVAKGDC